MIMPIDTKKQERKRNSMKIVVLAGGISAERAVSLASGTLICRALRENGHKAIFRSRTFSVGSPKIEDFWGLKEMRLN